jgi:hypothetical protein
MFEERKGSLDGGTGQTSGGCSIVHEPTGQTPRKTSGAGRGGAGTEGGVKQQGERLPRRGGWDYMAVIFDRQRRLPMASGSVPLKMGPVALQSL